MKIALLTVLGLTVMLQTVWPAAIETVDGESTLHFGFKTENGQSRSEDIKFNNTVSETKKGTDAPKAVEYRGGYSFISADGYEYTVLYRANKNGFQPYVTARKIMNP